MADQAVMTAYTADDDVRPAPSALIWLLAVGAGVGVANVYYIQPNLHIVQTTFRASPESVGLVPALTQGGYAAGMLFLAPLGDLIDRKKLIIAKSGALVIALAVSALAPSLTVLMVAGIAVGVFGSLGQDFVPAAAQLSLPTRRGRTVGMVTTGLLSGILLSRTLSGLVGGSAGWRLVYWIAAALVMTVAIAVMRFMPPSAPTARGSYMSLLRSLTSLVRRYGDLRKAVTTQALLAVSLGAFWSTLALMLAQPPFGLGPAIAGVFGLAGAAGAFGAPWFGHIADRFGTPVSIRLGCGLVLSSFTAMLAIPGSIGVLVAGTVLFDLGVMASFVSQQAIVTAIDPAARSRLNGILMTGAMVGVSVGAWGGSLAWIHFGWTGVCALGLVTGAIALVRSMLP